MLNQNDHRILRKLEELNQKALCIRAKISCIVAKNGKILVESNNDWLPCYDCTKIGCIRNILSIPSGHQREICYGLCAEQYCVSFAAKNGISLQGATLYCTKHPCRICASLVAMAGIKKVVYLDGYPDVLPHFDIFKTQKIETICVNNTVAKDLQPVLIEGQKTQTNHQKAHPNHKKVIIRAINQTDKTGTK